MLLVFISCGESSLSTFWGFRNIPEGLRWRYWLPERSERWPRLEVPCANHFWVTLGAQLLDLPEYPHVFEPHTLQLQAPIFCAPHLAITCLFQRLANGLGSDPFQVFCRSVRGSKLHKFLYGVQLVDGVAFFNSQQCALIGRQTCLGLDPECPVLRRGESPLDHVLFGLRHRGSRCWVEARAVNFF